MLDNRTPGPADTVPEIDATRAPVTVAFAPALPADSIDLKRTEDLRFSPDGRVLAVAGFVENTITLYSVETDGLHNADGTPVIRLTGIQRLTHPAIAYPHGLDFVDATTLAVANRRGNLIVLRLPVPPFDDSPHVPELLAEFDRATDTQKMRSPGSVAVTARRRHGYSLVACLNYAHKVTRQDIRIRRGHHTGTKGFILLSDGLDIPDGVSICPQTGRMAISNHKEHAVRLYRSMRWLKPWSAPIGRLLGLAYPHGLRFFDRGRALVVADAGAPFVNLYTDPSARWRGDRQPVARLRMMDDETFLRGHYNAQEGGPKGVDLHPSGAALLVTSEHQPIAAFAMPALLRLAQSAR